MKKVFTSGEDLSVLVKDLKDEGKKIVFTNGVFDIIHRGHVEYLQSAKELGDVLVVGLNSDISVKIIKGEKRPVVQQDNRAFVLSNLLPVDYVIIFDEETPYNLINKIMPHVLVKGADWPDDMIVGADIVRANGGEVKTINFLENNSSTGIIERIIQLYCK